MILDEEAVRGLLRMEAGPGHSMLPVAGIGPS
jgi:hypothetical protein